MIACTSSRQQLARYWFWSLMFVTLFVTLQDYRNTPTAAIFMKLAEQIANGTGIISLNSPGGSTVQWCPGRDLPCLASLILS